MTAEVSVLSSSVVQQIVTGDFNYTLMMNTYDDPGRKNLVGPTTQIELNQKVWVELRMEELDGDWVALVTKSCWATNQPSPYGGLRYDLIMNG